MLNTYRLCCMWKNKPSTSNACAWGRKAVFYDGNYSIVVRSIFSRTTLTENRQANGQAVYADQTLATPLYCTVLSIMPDKWTGGQAVKAKLFSQKTRYLFLIFIFIHRIPLILNSTTIKYQRKYHTFLHYEYFCPITSGELFYCNETDMN